MIVSHNKSSDQLTTQTKVVHQCSGKKVIKSPVCEKQRVKLLSARARASVCVFDSVCVRVCFVPFVWVRFRGCAVDVAVGTGEGRIRISVDDVPATTRFC